MTTNLPWPGKRRTGAGPWRLRADSRCGVPSSGHARGCIGRAPLGCLVVWFVVALMLFKLLLNSNGAGRIFFRDVY
ncbi:hypothetical protein [Burkholderia sp. F1]|uniref:hypothetical protein n=1 Tax=Burkholderia sp. F1 TaxID=3366817 RepID=UPI003D7458A4